ncbi:DUF362 domain-containing protein [Halorubrum depositum]|uniref:DUF362 domain-containing protein n=1 Tax=Halorubrum depositum TaxID=2583992 RepID=UPI00119E3D4F|nr:DUF362 domain-containing protein [Halorubrum depositum]
MTIVHGARLPDCEPDAIAEGVAEVLGNADVEFEGRVVLVPDLHYPYHPSTGTVTNPDTVSALVDRLLAAEAVDGVEIARAATAWSDDASCATYLGYDRLVERSGVEYFDPDAGPQASRTVSVDDQETVVTAPERLLDDALVVPALRRREDPTLAGCFDRLAAAALSREPTAFEVDSFAAAADPIGAVLDATYSYVGAPRRTRALLASADPFEVERVTAYLLGLDRDALPRGAARDDRPARVRGLDARALADELPDESVSEGSPSRLMTSGYRLYARVTGDQLPPQLMDR